MNGYGVRKSKGQYKSSLLPKGGTGIKPLTLYCKKCRGKVIHFERGGLAICRCCKTMREAKLSTPTAKEPERA